MALTPMITIVIVFVAVAFAARRFARRREREGEWDAKGPVHPTEPDARFLRLPGYFSERPEVVTEADPDSLDDDEPDGTTT